MLLVKRTCLMLMLFVAFLFPAFGQTILSGCTTIGTNGSYMLNQSVINSSSVNCMLINANNVILDCQGFAIDGNDTKPTSGINATGKTNITVKNCILSDWNDNIAFSSTNNSAIENVTASSGSWGIKLFQSNNNNLTNNVALNNTIGILVDRGANNTVNQNNASFGNQVGVQLFAASFNNVTNNTAVNNINFGIILSGTSNNNTLSGNVIESSDLTGLKIEDGSSNNIISNNAAKNSTWDYSTEVDAENNVITNLDIGDIMVSFMAKNINLKKASAPAADPTGLQNIGKFIEVENISEDGPWLFLNISYSDSDISGLDENELLMARHNSTEWDTDASGFSSTYGANTEGNYAFANITNFSIFALMAKSATNNTTAGSSSGSEKESCVTIEELGEIKRGTEQYFNICVGSRVEWTLDFNSYSLRLSGVEPSGARFKLNSEAFAIDEGQVFDSSGIIIELQKLDFPKNAGFVIKFAKVPVVTGIDRPVVETMPLVEILPALKNTLLGAAVLVSPFMAAGGKSQFGIIILILLLLLLAYLIYKEIKEHRKAKPPRTIKLSDLHRESQNYFKI